MKQKFGKYFFLVPLGLFVLSLSLILRQFSHLPDLTSGLITGAGLGLTLLPFVIRKMKLRQNKF